MQVELSNTTIYDAGMCVLLRLTGQFTASCKEEKAEIYTPVYRFGSWSCRDRIAIRSLHTVS
jgi:hypothetical protein